MQRTLVIAWALVLAMAFPAALGRAGAPEAVSYQGILTDTQGVVVENGLYTLTFRIFPGASGGSSVFGQQLQVDVQNGLYNVILSTWQEGTIGKDLGLAFETQGGRYMEVTIDAVPPGSTVQPGTTLQPRQEIASVPFALMAFHADQATEATHADSAAGLDSGTTQLFHTPVDRVTSTAVVEILNNSWTDLGLSASVQIPASGDWVVKASALVWLGHESGLPDVVVRLIQDDGVTSATRTLAAAELAGNPNWLTLTLIDLDDGVSAGSTYTYRIEAREADGDSEMNRLAGASVPAPESATSYLFVWAEPLGP
jgi:hypothetical protein